VAPGPNLQEIIDTVKADASSADPLDQLATASQTVAELEAVGDSVLSHFVDQCRRSGRSWSEISTALGVSKQAAHKRFSPATASLERWTPRAQSALRAAAEAARAFGHDYIGTEHLLFGLFEPAGGIAARILDELGFTRVKVEEQILAVAPRAAATATGTDLPYTLGAAEALGRTVSAALGLGHNYIGTEHLLLALFGGPDELASKILANGGAKYDDVKKRVLEKLASLTA
jgi:hypothetical protein